MDGRMYLVCFDRYVVGSIIVMRGIIIHVCEELVGISVSKPRLEFVM